MFQNITHRGITSINILLVTVLTQSLLENEKKLDVYELGVAEGIKEMLALTGFTKEKILNSTVSNLAETLEIDYYVALNIYNSAKKVSNVNVGFPINYELKLRVIVFV